MERNTPVVFIGSGEASALERKVLIHSLHKNSKGPVEIIVFNGTHNAIEHEDGRRELVPMSLPVKYQNITEFSNYRFMIPQLCGYQGRGIWLDSDMICLGDINELFQTPMHGADLLAKESPDAQGQMRWGLSVSLYDCGGRRFELDLYACEMAEGKYGYNDLQQLTSSFLAHHPFKVGALDPNWNCYDELSDKTKLIHYTNLHTQPWKVRGHRHGGLWFRYLAEAREAGLVTEADIELAIRRWYVRPDLRKGNTIGLGGILKNAIVDLKATVRDSVRPGA